MALVLSGDSPSLSGTYQGGAITSGTAVASTSGTSIDFTSIPNWVTRITVILNGVSTSATSALLVQLGDSGGVEITGYASSVGSIATATASVTSATTGFIVADINSGGNATSGLVTIANISSNIWVSSGNTKSSTNVIGYSAGDKSLSATLTTVRITTVNGTDTFDSGSINILYE
jgi:hypothetical protein